jgi:transglutaminase-like putative cysteine protease
LRRGAARLIHLEGGERRAGGYEYAVIKVRVGCEFGFTSTAPTPLVAMVRPKAEAGRSVDGESWSLLPAMSARDGRDTYGNEIRRMVLPSGDATLRYDVVVTDPGDPDDADVSAAYVDPDHVPDEVLTYLLPSRFCMSDLLTNEAWALFGGVEPGWWRVQAICDWVFAHIRFGYGASHAMTSSLDTFSTRTGVCRDFAQLGVTFCRAMNIPARYVFGYLPDIDVPPAVSPMDFCAWMEVYLGGRWWTFDPRNNQKRRIGHIVIGRGRDAADVPMVMTYGIVALQNITVWADQILSP